MSAESLSVLDTGPGLDKIYGLTDVMGQNIP